MKYIKAFQVLVKFIFIGCMAASISFATAQQSTPDLVIINMADTHSAYDAYPKILEGVKATKEKYKQSEMLFIFNGDLFELGDSVARNSKGMLDWEFFKKLSGFGPIVINIGNHEFDFSSPSEFVQSAEKVGASVIGTVALTGDVKLTPVFKDISVKGRTIRIVGIGTNQINTYPAALRSSLVIPEPVQWFKSNWEQITAGADRTIVASHSGLTADVSMLNSVTSTAKILYWVGGHDHLVIKQKVNGIDFLHNGFKGERFNIAEVYFTERSAQLKYTDVLTAEIKGEDKSMADIIAKVSKQYLAEADLSIIGNVNKTLSMVDAALWSTDVLKNSTGADAAFMPHSTIGAGLLAGSLNKYRFDLFMRFENDVMVATVDAATMKTIFAKSNQHDTADLSLRTGDFLYTRPVVVQDGKQYKIVTTGWAAMADNQNRYFGTKIEFKKLPDVAVKSMLIGALK